MQESCINTESVSADLAEGVYRWTQPSRSSSDGSRCVRVTTVHYTTLTVFGVHHLDMHHVLWPASKGRLKSLMTFYSLLLHSTNNDQLSSTRHGV